MTTTRIGIQALSFRWHGRGGFGAKTAAILLAEAVIDAGGYAQAAQEFGPERRGAPVQAFTRIADHRIAQRGPVVNPDVLAVLDPRLLDAPDTLAGATPDTVVFVNAPLEAQDVIASKVHRQVVLVDASAASREALGRDLPNVPMLAAVVVVLGLLPRDEFLRWLEKRLSKEFRPDVVAGTLRATKTVLAALPEQSIPTPAHAVDNSAAPPTYQPRPTGLRWQDAAAGPFMPAGTSRWFPTGDWRQQQPRLDLSKCIHCMLCWLYYPDSSIIASDGRIA
ncbi:MAG: 2-oxoacid:acceptor oxidoreductase family protein, partial [bacterium]